MSERHDDKSSPTWGELDDIQDGKSRIDLAERIWHLERQLSAPSATWRCSQCCGTGRIDNHVTGEVECGLCEGSGELPRSTPSSTMADVPLDRQPTHVRQLLKAEAAQSSTQRSEPVAWIRARALGGRYTGRLHKVTIDKLLDDDVPLYLAPPSAIAPMTDGQRLLFLFGAWAMDEHRDEIGDIDGGALQEQLGKLGLLESVSVSEPCGEFCKCAEYGDGFPTECLRAKPAVREALTEARKVLLASTDGGVTDASRS